ncbi:hypothetical protein H1S01_19650 [Heliobacterium chlorum]|uniref:Core-binding (CB) domain-containing protein n=1 Tax=Heliobacterium chlorum TaxID=2698 RepID=A0ABR7T7B6_HELCL|nr:hypothetical protein [Heliobacterium chlorum]MBC9786659.1 hypothetical protein [Heliobacterium chlorum]
MIAAFIEELRRHGKSPTTLRSYQDSWARFTRWYEREHPAPTPTGGAAFPQMATQLDIANFKRFAASHFKPNTVGGLWPAGYSRGPLKSAVMGRSIGK